jgi:pyruvate dehydrogenase E2 component (dihydrolipoamide acetyltransferase)
MERSPTGPPPDGDGGERVKASPVARRIARDRGVDLSALHGSGPGGRIVKADVEAAGAPAPAPAPAAPTAPDVATAKGDVSVQELNRTQQTIARRMAESRATVPDFTLQADVDMEAAVAARASLKTAAGEGQLVPSLNDMVVKACGLALREFPRVNSAYRDGRFERYSRVNVGVAVAAADALLVPTVFDADRRTLGEIARDTRALSERARDGAITPPELSGGTFSVSNLGMYGIREFTAVINPPQAAILSVGRVEPRAVVRDGEVVARHLMSVTLACDHRILYGADAAEFLARVRALLEAPMALAL